jgi:hypothetical protein
MASWSEVESVEPELAALVRQRFDAHGLGLLATLRRDGSPRISGVEPLFALGELWLGMMPNSRKALDLLRDPRFALHSATIDKEVRDGDAKLSGRAIPVDDEPTIERYRDAFAARTGYRPPPGPFHLFRAGIIDLSTVHPAGDHLDIRWWREGAGAGRLERR